MLKIRLRREGARNHPFFRVVVSDSRNTPTGPNIEILGHYDPKTDPPTMKIDVDRYQEWVDKGAIPSTTMKHLVRRLRMAPAEDAGS